LAAASIGQVHKAVRHDGTVVAVKVQYPGVEASLSVDIGNMQRVTPIGRLLFPGNDPREFFQELADRSLEECDYRKEAAHQQAFKAFFADDPRIVIPAVHEDLSTRRVLTTTFVEGLRFREFLMRAKEAE